MKMSYLHGIMWAYENLGNADEMHIRVMRSEIGQHKALQIKMKKYLRRLLQIDLALSI